MDDHSCEKEADLSSVSETEDVGDISWSRLQRNLDELNKQDDNEEDEQPSIHIDDDDLDIGELTFGSDDLEEAANFEENVGSARAARVIQQASSIRRVASATRSTSSSSNTALLESPASRSSPVPTPGEDEVGQEAAPPSEDNKDLGRLVEPDELKLIIENDEKCAICLEEFKAEQFVREINCKHTFHIECIDTWLVTHLNCPVCRNRLAEAEEEEEEEDGALDGRFFDLIGEAPELIRQIAALVNDAPEATGTVLRLHMGGLVVHIHAGVESASSPAMLETTATEEPAGAIEEPSGAAVVTAEALEPVRRKRSRRRPLHRECLRRRERLSRKSAHFSNYARLNRFRLN